MSGNTIISVLQVGLSGLAFLLAWLSFRLIAREQAKTDPKAEVLRTARLYFYQCIALAVIVAGFQVFNAVALRPGQREVSGCVDSLMLLEDQARQAKDSKVPTAAVEAHIARCKPVLSGLDQPK